MAMEDDGWFLDMANAPSFEPFLHELSDHLAERIEALEAEELEYKSAELPFGGPLNYSLGLALEAGFGTDATLLIGQDEARVSVHKVVLACSSSFFSDLFFGDGETAVAETEFRLQNVSLSTFKLLLEYMYKESLPPARPSADTVIELYTAARDFRLTGLLDYVQAFLASFIQPSTLIPILELSFLLDLRQLETECWDYMGRRTERVLESSLHSLTQSTLVRVLKREALAVTEEDLFQYVLQWAEMERALRNLPETPESLRLVAGSAFNYIRYPGMDPRNFTALVLPSRILSTAQVLEVYLHMNCPEGQKPKTGYEARARVRPPRARDPKHTAGLRSPSRGWAIDQKSGEIVFSKEKLVRILCCLDGIRESVLPLLQIYESFFAGADSEAEQTEESELES